MSFEQTEGNKPDPALDLNRKVRYKSNPMKGEFKIRARYWDSAKKKYFCLLEDPAAPNAPFAEDLLVQAD